MKPGNRLWWCAMLMCLLPIPALAGIEDSIQWINRKIDQETSARKKVEVAMTFIGNINRNHPEASRKICHRVLPLARKHSNKATLAELYQYLGVSHAQTGQSDSALYYYHKAYALVKRHLPFAEHYAILNRLGIFYLDKSNLDSARYYFIRTLKAAEQSVNAGELAGVNNNLGIIYHDMGELHTAYAHYQKAYQYYKSNDSELVNRALTLNNMALIHAKLGQSQKAIALYQMAIVLHKQVNALEDLATAYGNLGTLYKDMGVYDSAIRYQTMAWRVSVEISDVFGQARTLMNMGNIYKKQNRYPEALKSYQESMTLCLEHDIAFGVMLNHTNLGELYSETQMYMQANDHLLKALSLAKTMQLKPIEAEVYQTMFENYKKQGKYEKALQYHMLYHTLKDSLDHAARIEEIHKMEATLEAREQQMKNTQLQKQLQQKALRIRNQRIAGGVIFALLLVAIGALVVAIRSRVQLWKTNRILHTLNTEIMEQNRELEEVSTAKDKLFSIVAHDLRSPFNGLLGILSVLTEEFDSFPEQKRRKVLQSSYQQAVTTFGLIENLLQWSMNQRGMIKMHHGFHDLQQIAEVELSVLKGRIERKRLEVINQIEPASIAWVDFDLVRVILRNTINNAIKFTPEGGQVVVSSIKAPDTLSVIIKDTGIGMTQEMVSEVFKLSNHHHREGTDREKGSGLGLVIVYEFVQMLNAQIEIRSEMGAGTTILLYFPAGPEHLKSDPGSSTTND